jgi:hypothetical protein
VVAHHQGGEHQAAVNRSTQPRGRVDDTLLRCIIFLAASPEWADAVEKVFLGWWTKFFRAAGACNARRGEGPRRPTRKHSHGFVHVLPGPAAEGAAENRFLQDFSDCSIFDFFDSIGQMRTDAVQQTAGRALPVAFFRAACAEFGHHDARTEGTIQ